MSKRSREECFQKVICNLAVPARRSRPLPRRREIEDPQSSLHAESLAGRPSHLSSAEQMQMQVIDALPSVGASVDHQAKAAAAGMHAEALLLCHYAGCAEKLTQQRRLSGGAVGERPEVLFGNQEDVHRRLWMNVGKGQHIAVLIETLHRDGATCDLAEEAIKVSSHGCILNPAEAR